MKLFINALALGAAILSVGALSIDEIDRKTDSELMQLLTNSDSFTRALSLAALSVRFRNPQKGLPMSPFRSEPRSKETPLPSGLLEEAISRAKEDSDLRVRIAAVGALSAFKFRTNTSPVLTSLLNDPCCIIRIRAAQALIGFEDDYHEPTSDKVVTVLINCLDPKNSPDDLWQAAYTLGNLGLRAQKSLPSLKLLEENKSEQVREYAREAIQKIQNALKRNSP